MSEHHVKVRVVEWDDREFVLRFEEALAVALEGAEDIDREQVADRVQDMLRTGGYPQARVKYDRSVDDVLAGVAHWTVAREGIIPAAWTRQ